jgi:hypothetical protein
MLSVMNGHSAVGKRVKILHDISGQENPREVSSSALSKHGQGNSIALRNQLSIILNHTGKTAHPVVEEAPHIINSEVIPHIRGHVFDFVTRGKLPILEDSFQNAKEPKVTRTYVQRIRGIRDSEKARLPEFRLDL